MRYTNPHFTLLYFHTSTKFEVCKAFLSGVMAHFFGVHVARFNLFKWSLYAAKRSFNRGADAIYLAR